MAKSNWKVDPAHSSLDFSVKHMMISKVKGTFHDFGASVEADPADLTDANIQFTVDVSSIDTRNGDRDGHLKSGDFFNAEEYPEMTFQSTNITKKSDGEYDVTGDLTIRGTTRPATFELTFEGQSKDPMSGNHVVGFSGEGKINRSEFGLEWNAALETGGVLIGDEVKIFIEIEASEEA
ncbi:MAG TPA: YceI family protein [Bacillales bacterium]|nr:YceI family protein [Bacillales bacterium]